MSSGIPPATTPPSAPAGSARYCGGASCEAEVARAVALIAGRWSVPVLEALCLVGAPVRFRELQRRVGVISQKELTRQLSLFVHHGVVVRRAGSTDRASVHYAITERGMSLLQRMDALGRWVKEGRGAPAPANPDERMDIIRKDNVATF